MPDKVTRTSILFLSEPAVPNQTMEHHHSSGGNGDQSKTGGKSMRIPATSTTVLKRGTGQHIRPSNHIGKGFFFLVSQPGHPATPAAGRQSRETKATVLVIPRQPTRSDDREPPNTGNQPTTLTKWRQHRRPKTEEWNADKATKRE
ncbi:hypothetical protein Nepgr_010497 [Nepenthes gracilis]|uniref:Uncharacterized protein n=1 Tax=Nepenthes gracilis TaxID=150966 RepID=A0AAD3SDJ0_NEPGR|nr:hypothetical protein Nepgr_010497 [Nepenthes gracilis]